MLPDVAGNPRFFRIAVAQDPTTKKYGCIIVDDRNRVLPIGSNDFESESAATQALQMALAKAIGMKH